MVENIEKMDIVIPCHHKDINILPLCIAGCKKNIPSLGTIYLVSDDVKIEDSKVIVLRESQVIPDLTVHDIKERWNKKAPENSHRAGWLFQQFIKLGSCKSIPALSEIYLILDADVVFLKKMSFQNASGQLLLSPASESNAPYYECYRRLFGDNIEFKYSFVSHHFPVKRTILHQMLNDIERRLKKNWYESILDVIDYTQPACFSEYETMGYYMTEHFDEQYSWRKLVNIQSFKWKYLPLLWLGLADYVTVHNYKRPENSKRTNKYLFKIYNQTLMSKTNLKRLSSH